jgi:hypothetical protein
MESTAPWRRCDKCRNGTCVVRFTTRCSGGESPKLGIGISAVSAGGCLEQTQISVLLRNSGFARVEKWDWGEIADFDDRAGYWS